MVSEPVFYRIGHCASIDAMFTFPTTRLDADPKYASSHREPLGLLAHPSPAQNVASFVHRIRLASKHDRKLLDSGLGRLKEPPSMPRMPRLNGRMSLVVVVYIAQLRCR